MSKTNRGEKGPGYEYWASRSDQYDYEWNPGSASKRKTHREERRNRKRQDRDLLEKFLDEEYDDEEI